MTTHDDFDDFDSFDDADTPTDADLHTTRPISPACYDPDLLWDLVMGSAGDPAEVVR